eukprot:scaffold196776_cov32-Tisochrysis_lutea.AAC.4
MAHAGVTLLEPTIVEIGPDSYFPWREKKTLPSGFRSAAESGSCCYGDGSSVESESLPNQPTSWTPSVSGATRLACCDSETCCPLGEQLPSFVVLDCCRNGHTGSAARHRELTSDAAQSRSMPTYELTSDPPPESVLLAVPDEDAVWDDLLADWIDEEDEPYGSTEHGDGNPWGDSEDETAGVATRRQLRGSSGRFSSSRCASMLITSGSASQGRSR